MVFGQDVDALRAAVPQHTRVQRFGDKTRRYHGARLNQLCRYVQCICLSIDIGGCAVNRDAHAGAVLLCERRLGGAVPLHLRVQRFKNRTERNKGPPADDGRLHIGLQRTAVHIQVDGKGAGQQHAQHEQYSDQLFLHALPLLIDVRTGRRQPLSVSSPFSTSIARQ